MLNGINSKTTAGIADAIATSLNGQELTKTQRKRLSSSLGSPAVQSVISDMQKTLTSRSGKVSQNPTARNVGQLYTTVQTANNQANAAVNQTNTVVKQEDVAKSLRNKGVYSRKVDGLAEAIAARLNDQELTRSQRSFLSFELGSPAVQDVISEFIKKKAAEVDSTQSNVYDRKNVARGVETREEAALWDFTKQKVGGDRSGVPGTLRGIGSLSPETFSAAQRRGLTSEVDVFGDNDYATVMEGSSLHQVQKAVPEEIYAGGSKTRTFREATQQDADLIIGIKTRYNAGKTRNAASAKGTINGKSIALECISGKFSHDNYYNKGNFEPPQPENYHYKGPIPEYTNHTEQKIVEYLREQFKDNPNVSGEIEIISERIYCDNCKALVDMFEAEFPNIKVTRVEVLK